MLVFCLQWSESAVCIHIFPLSCNSHPNHLGHRRAPSWAPCGKLSSFLPSVLHVVVCICQKAMAPHSSTLAWKIPWMEEPGRLQSMGSLRIRDDWATSLSLTSLSLSCIGEGNGNSLQCYCLENPRDRGAWWAFAYGVAQSRTRLKRLSSSSSSCYLVSGSILPISIRQLDFDPNSCMSSNRPSLWDLGAEPYPVFPGVSQFLFKETSPQGWF